MFFSIQIYSLIFVQIFENRLGQLVDWPYAGVFIHVSPQKDKDSALYRRER